MSERRRSRARRRLSLMGNRDSGSETLGSVEVSSGNVSVLNPKSSKPANAAPDRLNAPEIRRDLEIAFAGIEARLNSAAKENEKEDVLPAELRMEGEQLSYIDVPRRARAHVFHPDGSCCAAVCGQEIAAAVEKAAAAVSKGNGSSPMASAPSAAAALSGPSSRHGDDEVNGRTPRCGLSAKLARVTSVAEVRALCSPQEGSKAALFSSSPRSEAAREAQLRILCAGHIVVRAQTSPDTLPAAENKDSEDHNRAILPKPCDGIAESLPPLVSELNPDQLEPLRYVRAQPTVRVVADNAAIRKKRGKDVRDSKDGSGGARVSMQSLFRAVGGRTSKDAQRSGQKGKSSTGGDNDDDRLMEGADEGPIEPGADPIEAVYLKPYDKKTTDAKNAKARADHRYPILQLFPNGSLKRKKRPKFLAPGFVPTGTQVLVTARSLQFELEGVIEPFYCTMAVYNLQRRERVSETFSFDVNSAEQRAMVVHDEADMSQPSSHHPSVVFTLAQPNTDLYLVLRVSKVLQGDAESVSEPYIKHLSLKDKDRRKASVAVSDVCLRLGRYRQPFVWGMVPLFDESGSLAPEFRDGNTVDVKPLYRVRAQETGDASFLQSVADVYGNRTSTSSKRLKIVPGALKCSFRDLTKQVGPVLLPQRFTSTGLHVLANYNPYAYRGLKSKHKKEAATPSPPSAAAKKGKEKLEDSEEFCTDELREDGLVLEMDAMASQRAVEPRSEFVHTLFVYPESVTIGGRSGSRNVGVRAVFLENEPLEGKDSLTLARAAEIAENKPEGAIPRFVDRDRRHLAWSVDTLITYHTKNPQFHDELKLYLPEGLKPQHHILFLFYHISAKRPKPMSPVKKETPLGFSVLPLLRFVPLVPLTAAQLVNAALEPVNTAVKGEDSFADDSLVPVPLGESHVLPVAQELPGGYVDEAREYAASLSRVQEATEAAPSAAKELGVLGKELASAPITNGARYLDGGKPLFRLRALLHSSLSDQSPELSRALQHMRSEYSSGASAAADHALAAWLSVPASLVIDRLPLFLGDMMARLQAPGLNDTEAGRIFRTFLNVLSAVDDVCRKRNADLGALLGSYVRYVFDPPDAERSAAIAAAAVEAALKEATASKSPSGDSSSSSEGKSRSKGGSSRSGSKSSSKGKSRSSSSSKSQKGGSKVKSSDHKHEAGDNGALHASDLKVRTLPHLICDIWVAELRRLSAVGELQVRYSSFFFGIIHKCLVAASHEPRQADQCIRKIARVRTQRASGAELAALRKLLAHIAWEVAERRSTALTLAKDLLQSAGFFVRDLFTILDRGSVTTLARVVLEEMRQISVVDLTLVHFFFDYALLLCQSEYYIPLSLPVYSSSQSPNRSKAKNNSPGTGLSLALIGGNSEGGSSGSGGGLVGVGGNSASSRLLRNHVRMHPLPGLLVELIDQYVDHEEKAVRTKVITVLRDLLLEHERDARYQSLEDRRRIAYLYLPLLPLCVDKADHLQGQGADAPPYSEKRSLLACILWVLKNVEPTLLRTWWRSESQARLTRFLDVCRLCVDVFALADEDVLVQLMADETDQSLDTKTMLENFYTQAVGGVGATGQGSTRYRSLREKRAEAVRTRQFRQRAENANQQRSGARYPYHEKREAHLNKEANLIILDAVEHFFALNDQALRRPPPNMLMENLLGELLVRMMETQQCVEFLDHVYATLRSLLARFRSELFHPNAAYCGDIIPTVLHQCNVPAKAIRAQAAAFMYLLMRSNYDEKNGNITRMKVQTTNAVAKLVSQLQDDHNLRKSLSTISAYTTCSVDGSPSEKGGLIRQVEELVAKLETILRDSLQIQQYRDDQQMMEDLIHRVAHSYTSTPDLRVTWLDNLCDEHKKVEQYAEAACATLHIAALVAEYLYLLEPDPDSGLPDGCNAFVGVTPNCTEESLEDIVSSLEEEGVCESSQFSRRGLVKLLRRGVEQFKSAELYESAHRLYKILLPIYEAGRDYAALQNAHQDIGEIFGMVQQANQTQSRMFGTYYRVALYGKPFAELAGKEYIYKEPKITRLGEIVSRLQGIYEERYGKVIVIQESSTFDDKKLAKDQVAIQVTKTEPYFEAWEAKSRVTYFELNNNINQFVFETPFTKDGKAHAESLHDQWKRKTILTTSHTFPYVKTRLEVVDRQEVELSPIENSIETLELQRNRLAAEVSNPTPNANSLQMVLQGSVLLQVNQGPKAICEAFLTPEANNADISPEQIDYLRRTFHRFLQTCSDAIELNSEIHTEDQTDYHDQLCNGYRALRDYVRPNLDAADASSLLSPRSTAAGSNESVANKRSNGSGSDMPSTANE